MNVSVQHLAADTIARLLLVEDNPGDADFIGELLDDVSCEITKAVTLAEATGILQDAAFDAVLLDLNLPDGEGAACVETILAASPRVPIVVLTGMDEEALALACLTAGAQDYLAKNDLRRANLLRALRYARARTREAAEQARAEQLQALLAALVEASSDAIISGAADGTISSWNAAAETIFGRPAGEALGRPAREVLRPLDIANAMEQRGLFAEALQGQGGKEREITMVSPRGEEMTLSLTAFALRDEAARAVTHFGAICRDVTEKRRQEEQLELQYELLLSRDRQMRALAAKLNTVREEEQKRIAREVHDELGQKLTALKLDIWWLQRKLGGPDPAIPDGLEARLTETRSLIDATIATVQRIASELRPASLDVLGLAAAMEDELRRFELRAGLQVEAVIESEDLPGPEAATAFYRILQEILTNVARHASARYVRIEFEAREKEWCLMVSDDGVGISPEKARSNSPGLLGMRERAEHFGGAVSIGPGDAGGVTAIARIPRSHRTMAAD